MNLLNRFRGCLLGLAAGDAVGTALEFKGRGSFAPISDMVGDGPFHLQPGQWTDDTSLALCLATSLVECRGFDARDQMERYWRWYREGYLSSTGTCFNIGSTTLGALLRYRDGGNPFSGSPDPMSAGNGSLMRLAPVVMYYHCEHNLALHYSIESSRTTHAAPQCLDACQLFAELLLRTLAGEEKESILMGSRALQFDTDEITEIAQGSYMRKSEPEIEGSGYVVKSLEAALWCFWNTSSYEAAILQAANLGDDADTTAAVCGQIAGAYYGMEGIPAHWLERLSMRDEIAVLADQLEAGAPC